MSAFLRRLVSTATSRPLISVALAATAVAIGHALWIWTHRRIGAYDPDEAGYIASSLRIHRSIDLRHPFAVLIEASKTTSGPVVPVLGVLLLLPGPRDPHTVMMVQPILMVVSCVAVAGIAGRLASRTTSLCCGLAYLAIPTVALATQSLWLGLGASTMMALAIWALLSSDRGNNPWIWAYGLAMAAMPLSRTMALGFVPGLIAAGVVIAWGDRRALARVAAAVLLAVGVAGPWFFAVRESVFGYLIGYGYGERAGLFGSGTVLDRLDFRYERIAHDVGRGLTTSALVVAAVGAGVIAWSWWHSDRPARLREMAAVAITVAAGLAALVSTSNNGVWFELPIIVLLVPLVGALIARAFWPLRALIGLQLVGQAVVVLAVLWWLTPPKWEITAHYENGFAQYDPRFSATSRDLLPGAADDWAEPSSTVERSLRRLDGGTGLGIVVSFSGNMQLFNTNTVGLQAELRGWGPRLEVPDTTESASARAEYLTPTAFGPDGRTVERILVIARHDQHLFTPDENVDEFFDQAEELGWVISETVPMPDGGDVVIMRHPGSDADEKPQTKG